MPDTLAAFPIARGGFARCRDLARRAAGSDVFWIAICLAAGALLAYLHRHRMNPDGLSYLDLASEARRRGGAELVSGYWSPAYPGLIYLVLAVFDPSAGSLFPALHALNFAIFALALWSFHFLLRSTRYGVGDEMRPFLLPFAFGAFLWFSLSAVGVENVTPDLLVGACILLAGGLIWRLATRPDSAARGYAWLGAVLTLGYAAKAALLPINLALLGILFLFPPAPTFTRRRIGLVLLVFLALSVPLAALVSVRLGHPSFGEAGRLNYIWYANHRELTSYIGWSGTFGSARAGLAHPPRLLVQSPAIVEFDDAVPGTQPLWYDPCYWWAGATVRFSPGQQHAAVRENLRVLRDWLAQAWALIAGILVMFALVWREGRRPGLGRLWTWQWLWPLAACAIYLPVHLEPRFLGLFALLGFLALYAAVLPRANRVASGLVLLLAVAIPLLPFARKTLSMAAHEFTHPGPPADQVAAAALRSFNLKPGDRLATVGVDFLPAYARLAGLRIGAQAESPAEFWAAAPGVMAQTEAVLAGAGIKAIVSRTAPPANLRDGWRAIRFEDEDFLYVLPLPGRIAPLR